MSMTRVLPLGAPVAAGMAIQGGVVLLLSLLGLFLMLLAARSIWLRAGSGDDTRGGARA